MQLGDRMGVEDYPSFAGRRVLIRTDFNVPLDEQQHITSNQRIVASLPTINYVLGRGAKAVVLMSHLGRPDGQRNGKYSLSPVAAELSRLLGRPVQFVQDCVGPDVEAICADPPGGSVILLENLRFHPEEESAAGDVAAFRRSLQRLGDVYVNDAFGTVHRAHSSIVGIDLEPRLAGLLVQKELKAFSRLLESPARIDVAILGGAKVSDKIQLIIHLLAKVKSLIIGGGMAFTLLKHSQGMAIGSSLYDPKGAELVGRILQEAREQNVTIYLPVDFVAANGFREDAEHRLCTAAEGIPDGWMGLDIGPESCRTFAGVVGGAQTVIWNGPMGVFEWDAFAAGTKAVLDAMLSATKDHQALTIVGGGDSATAVAKWRAEAGLSHVSTGGGASIELLEGRELPGIAALTPK